MHVMLTTINTACLQVTYVVERVRWYSRLHVKAKVCPNTSCGYASLAVDFSVFCRARH